MKDLFNQNDNRVWQKQARIVAEYDYRDEDGKLLFQVRRFDPKDFRQRRPNGNGGWQWNLGDTRRVLFRLPSVVKAAQTSGTVYVVEGEKDVLAVEREGGVATCNPGGAGKWREEYSNSLVGAHCRIIADNDAPGFRHARDVARSLRSQGASVQLLKPAHGKDASDHFIGGFGLDDFVLLGEETLEDLADEVVTTNEDGGSEILNQSDTGNAHLFARLHGRDVRFDFKRNRWLIWTGHRWAPDADGRLVRMAEEVARRRYEDAWNILDKEEAKKAAKFAINSENRTRVMAMLELARAQPPIADTGENWDSHPMFLGVRNGVVDLRTGELRDGRRDDRVTMQADVPFELEASCPRWLRFLTEVFNGDNDLIEYIWRAVGYSFTGDISEQCLFLLHGFGANGKSTFLNAIRRAVGDYGYNMPFTTLEVDRRCSVPNDLAALVDRRLVTSSETNEVIKLNEGRVKALTGGDPVTARFLHKEFFTFRPAAKFWLGVNHKPRVTDDSHGFWRRVRLVPFTQQFPGDKRLEPQLEAEAPGILRWAVEGCRLWQERGLDPPDCVQTATDEYRRESDLLEEFIAERIEVTREAIELPVREIVEAYNQWAEREGLKPRERLGSRGLRSRLKARWPDRHRPAVRRTPARYVGLKLQQGDV
jgi:putative DNA primase/helicase